VTATGGQLSLLSATGPLEVGERVVAVAHPDQAVLGLRGEVIAVTEYLVRWDMTPVMEAKRGPYNQDPNLSRHHPEQLAREAGVPEPGPEWKVYR
jgi:hypothetical protein